MTKKTSTPAPVPNGPAFVVWFAPAREGAPWTRLGALWPTKSGKGFHMSLELMPVAEGNLIVMPYEPRKAEGGEGA